MGVEKGGENAISLKYLLGLMVTSMNMIADHHTVKNGAEMEQKPKDEENKMNRVKHFGRIVRFHTHVQCNDFLLANRQQLILINTKLQITVLKFIPVTNNVIGESYVSVREPTFLFLLKTV